MQDNKPDKQPEDPKPNPWPYVILRDGKVVGSFRTEEARNYALHCLNLHAMLEYLQIPVRLY